MKIKPNIKEIDRVVRELLQDSKTDLMENRWNSAYPNWLVIKK